MLTWSRSFLFESPVSNLKAAGLNKMSANIILVATNLPFIRTAIRCGQRGQYVPMAAITFAGLASMLYYGSENDLTPGLGYAKSKRARAVLLKIKRTGTAAAVLTVLYQVGIGHVVSHWPYGLMLLPYVVVEISEVSPPFMRECHLAGHVLYHSCWNIGVFVLADWILA
jgi:hypothetical protein